jgi:hypothetical protein
MNNRCISVNYNLEHDFVNSLIYPQAILIEDINNDNVRIKIFFNFALLNLGFFQNF